MKIDYFLRLSRLGAAFFVGLGVLMPVWARAVEPAVIDLALVSRLKGKILLQVEAHGEAWYVHPLDGLRYYMRDGAVAYQMMRSFGLGITDADLAKIPLVAETTEMKNSTGLCGLNALANRLRGRILLQVQQRGEAWYVDTVKCRRIYMKDGAAAYSIMRFLSLGITNADLEKLPGGTIEIEFLPPPPPAPEPAPAPAPSPEPTPDSNKPIARTSGNIQVNGESPEAVLDGRNSSDPQGDSLTYQWTFVSGPISAVLQNANSAQVVLRIPKDFRFKDFYAQPGQYLIQLIVSDGINQSDPTFVTVTVDPFTSFEKIMLNRMNVLRAAEGEAGAVPLALNEKLTAAARKYARYMRDNNWFEHDDREGRSFADRIAAEGYNYRTVGENIGVVKSSIDDLVLDAEAVDFMFQGWKNSPSHYVNMISADFLEAGFGFSLGPVNDPEFPFQYYATQEFGKAL